jgi:hypothetical protein
MADLTNYASFRQRLDAVLRTRDVRQVRAFLIEENQWSLDVPVDPEHAMWLMIAGTPTLKDLHPEARRWLTQHGHAEEAETILARDKGDRKGGKASPGKKSPTGQRKAHPSKPPKHLQSDK